MKSTMTWLIEENASLRRSGKIDRIVYWTCVSVVIGFAAYKLFGGQL